MIKPKRLRAPTMQDNTLKLGYANVDGTPDIVTCWGNGCGRADSRLIMHTFCIAEIHGKTLVDHFKERGYDISTIKFSIKKSIKSEQ